MTSTKLRHLFIEFFAKKQHKILPSFSLIPENDASVLFNTAGMQPLVPYFLEAEHPEGPRLVDCQKCLRTGDIEEVGDGIHFSFFEMLGNWSLGDYFKEQAIEWAYEFLTDKSYLNIDAKNLYVTVFEGEKSAQYTLEADQQSYQIWEKYLPKTHIFYQNKDHNWWGPVSDTGPCGPDTEIYIDTQAPFCNENCRPGCDCSKFMELWNLVFLQYNKQSDGSYLPLNKNCVDTGMGLERALAVLNGVDSAYQTDLFASMLKVLEAALPSDIPMDEHTKNTMGMICDHFKASFFLLCETPAVTPSNIERGYVVRKLIRRCWRGMHKLKLNQQVIAPLQQAFIGIYQSIYPEVLTYAQQSLSLFEKEINAFNKALEKGENEFKKLINSPAPLKELSGEQAFKMYETYGFPIEMIRGLAQKYHLVLDEQGFHQAYKNHQKLSQQNKNQLFRGGLMNHSVESTRLHTATHLLHKALQIVLGPNATQKGSNITPERLRFDFSYPQKLTDAQIKAVEDLVNQQIQLSLPVTKQTMSLQEAQNLGAMALFTDKYQQSVSVYSIGDFSKEVCGGPHVQNTKELGSFKIIKEQAASAGIRRIKAILEHKSPST